MFLKGLISFLKFVLLHLENLHDYYYGIDYKCNLKCCNTRKGCIITKTRYCNKHEEEYSKECFNYHVTSLWDTFKDFDFDTSDLNEYQKLYDEAIKKELYLRQSFKEKYSIPSDDNHARFEYNLRCKLNDSKCNSCGLRVISNGGYGNLSNHIFNGYFNCCTTCNDCKNCVYGRCNECNGLYPLSKDVRIQRIEKIKNDLKEKELREEEEKKNDELLQEIREEEDEIYYCLDEASEEIKEEYYKITNEEIPLEMYLQKLINFRKTYFY